AQRVLGATPAYQLVQEKGPDHSKSFKVAAHIAGELYPPAWGRNKKEAEQRAARNALSELRSNDTVQSSPLAEEDEACYTNLDEERTIESLSPTGETAPGGAAASEKVNCGAA